MSNLDDFGKMIAKYRLKEAIEDGIIVKLCDIYWNGVSMPYVATKGVLEDIGRDGAMEIWKEFADWRTSIMLTLPEEDQLFSTGVNGKKVWVIEDGSAYTVMYPKDYWARALFKQPEPRKTFGKPAQTIPISPKAADCSGNQNLRKS